MLAISGTTAYLIGINIMALGLLAFVIWFAWYESRDHWND